MAHLGRIQFVGYEAESKFSVSLIFALEPAMFSRLNQKRLFYEVFKNDFNEPKWGEAERKKQLLARN